MLKTKSLKLIAGLRLLRGVAIFSFVPVFLVHKNTSFPLLFNGLLDDLGIDPTVPLLISLSNILHKIDGNLIIEITFILFVWGVLLFAQAYGLWHQKRWAVKLALITSALVLASGAYLLSDLMSVSSLILFILNMLIALYLFFILKAKQLE